MTLNSQTGQVSPFTLSRAGIRMYSSLPLPFFPLEILRWLAFGAFGVGRFGLGMVKFALFAQTRVVCDRLLLMLLLSSMLTTKGIHSCCARYSG